MFKVIKSEDAVFEKNRIELYREGADGQEIQYADEMQASTEYVDAEVERIYEEARKRAGQSAARILEGAYAKRDKIVSAAEEDVKRVRQKAHHEGYEEGLADAVSKVEEELAAMQKALEDIRETQQKNAKILQKDLMELSLIMTEKILHKRIEADELEMLELARAVVLSEKDKKHITVQISGQMMQLAEQLERELEMVRDRFSNSVKVKTVSMPEDTCRVETEDGITDASVFVQLENLKNQLVGIEDI